MGSSQLPGTLCVIIFNGFTPRSRSFFFAPSTRGVIKVGFQRACTMRTRRLVPENLFIGIYTEIVGVLIGKKRNSKLREWMQKKTYHPMLQLHQDL